MKICQVLFFIGLVAGTYSFAIDNDFCKGKSNGNYVNSEDKGTYLACSNGFTFVMPCPDGLKFNPNKGAPWGQCDWPKKDKAEIESDSSGDSNCSSSSSSSEDCDSKEPTTTTKKPHPPTTTTKKPDPPTTTRISHPPTTTTTTKKPCTPDFSCQGRADGNYPNPRDCNSYIACSNGYPYVMPCPAGLHFNPSVGLPWGWCDWPENANCDWVDSDEEFC